MPISYISFCAQTVGNGMILRSSVSLQALSAARMHVQEFYILSNEQLEQPKSAHLPRLCHTAVSKIPFQSYSVDPGYGSNAKSGVKMVTMDLQCQ
jgi:hypothetical protein